MLRDTFPRRLLALPIDRKQSSRQQAPIQTSRPTQVLLPELQPLVLNQVQNP